MSFMFIDFVECLTFGCILGSRIDDFVELKMLFSFFNVLLGLVFIFLYVHYRKNFTVRKEKKVGFWANFKTCFAEPKNNS